MNVVGGIRHGCSIRTAFVRRGPPEPCLSLVLQDGFVWFNSRSFDVFQNRHGRFCDSDVLRYVFEAVVAQCIGAGLAIGQRYAANANIIAADASRQKLTPKADWNPEAIDPDSAPRQVQEYLDTLDDAVQGNHGAR